MGIDFDIRDICETLVVSAVLFYVFNGERLVRKYLETRYSNQEVLEQKVEHPKYVKDWLEVLNSQKSPDRNKVYGLCMPDGSTRTIFYHAGKFRTIEELEIAKSNLVKEVSQEGKDLVGKVLRESARVESKLVKRASQYKIKEDYRNRNLSDERRPTR